MLISLHFLILAAYYFPRHSELFVNYELELVLNSLLGSTPTPQLYFTPSFRVQRIVESLDFSI